MRMTAANILTLMRMILVPVFVMFFIEKSFGWSLLIFCIAGGTDLIDGTVARMLKQDSKSGALLDPLADKFLIQSCFLVLAFSGVLPWWFFALAAVRDAMIVGGIIYLKRTKVGLPYRASLISKIATLLQLGIAILGVMLLWRPETMLAGHHVTHVLQFLFVLTAGFLIASGVDYIMLGLKLVRRHRNQAV